MSDLHRIAELNHLINSPLAAIRNALYLAESRTDDPELVRYLEICNSEVTSIAAFLREALAATEAAKRPARAQLVRFHRAAA